MNGDTLNTATFNTFVHLLGLTAAEISQRLNVNLRTVQRWLSGESSVPEFVAEWISELVGWVCDTVDTAVEAIADMVEKHGEPDGVDLVRYQNTTSAERAGITVPLSVHTTAVGMIAVEVVGMGLTPVVSFAPDEK